MFETNKPLVSISLVPITVLSLLLHNSHILVTLLCPIHSATSFATNHGLLSRRIARTLNKSLENICREFKFVIIISLHNIKNDEAPVIHLKIRCATKHGDSMASYVFSTILRFFGLQILLTKGNETMAFCFY